MNPKFSMLLSHCCVAFFALVLLLVDATAWHFIPLWFSVGQFQPYAIPVMTMIYLLSVPAWTALVGLWRLLNALRGGKVFTQANIYRLRLISWCCFAVTAIMLLCLLWMQPLTGLLPLEQMLMLVLPVAAALMGLIVRIVKNVFEQAALMKDELDYTV